MEWERQPADRIWANTLSRRKENLGLIHEMRKSENNVSEGQRGFGEKLDHWGTLRLFEEERRGRKKNGKSFLPVTGITPPPHSWKKQDFGCEFRPEDKFAKSGKRKRGIHEVPGGCGRKGVCFYGS